MGENVSYGEIAKAQAMLRSSNTDGLDIHGYFQAVCRDQHGDIKWEEPHFPNTVCTLGKNYMLDSGLSASALTVVGPFMGMISSVSYTAIAAGDTSAAHAGWTEAGTTNAPTYSGGRKTCVWSVAAAGSKSLSTGLVFSFTGSGTIKGVAIWLGTGAVATVLSTTGVLLSAGLFNSAPFDRVVANGDTVTVTYTMQAT